MDAESKSYMEWLTSDILELGQETIGEFSYSIAASFLTPFDPTCYVPNDENRAISVELLRNEFRERFPENATYLDQIAPTVFEILSVLVLASYDMLQDYGYEPPTLESIFVEYMTNLCGRDDNREAQRNIVKFSKRDFNRLAIPSPFPLNPLFFKKDARKMELWYIMCEYIREHVNV